MLYLTIINTWNCLLVSWTIVPPQAPIQTSKSRHITPLLHNRYYEEKRSSRIRQVSKGLHQPCHASCFNNLVDAELHSLFASPHYLRMRRPKIVHSLVWINELCTLLAWWSVLSSENTSSPSTPATQSAPNIFDNFPVGAIRRGIHRKFTEKQHLTLSTLETERMTKGSIHEQTSQTAV